MKKAVIYVFTGTGNTRLAADMVAEALLKRGIQTAVWEARVPFTSAPDPRAFDLAGFAYPIHAFNTPQFFLRFFKTLPDVDGIPAIVFKTSGEPSGFNNASSWPLLRLLRKKGFVPTMDRHLLMPYNIMFRYRDSLVKQMYFHTRDMADMIADKAANGVLEKQRYRPWTILFLYVMRIQWFGARINGPLIHVRKDLCSGCGLCVRICPPSNIRIKDGYPHFSSQCTMCMGCALLCPKDAVRPGLLAPVRVNGAYAFRKLAKDDTVPDKYVDEHTKGYFRLFKPYYARTYSELEAYRYMGKETKYASQKM